MPLNAVLLLLLLSSKQTQKYLSTCVFVSSNVIENYTFTENDLAKARLSKPVRGAFTKKGAKDVKSKRIRKAQDSTWRLEAMCCKAKTTTSSKSHANGQVEWFGLHII